MKRGLSRGDVSSYSQPLFISVYFLCIFAMCVLFYLLYINLSARKALKKWTPEVALGSTNLCLWCLCILHVISFFNITAILLKNLDDGIGPDLCAVVNNCLETGTTLSQVFIWLVLECRQRIMRTALESHSVWARGGSILTRIMVAAPLFLLPFALNDLQNDFDNNEGPTCCLSISTNKIDMIKMWGGVIINLTFCGIFLCQVCKAFRKMGDRMMLSELPPELVYQKVKSATLRNLIVTCCTFMWPMGFYLFLQSLDTSETQSRQIFYNRLVKVLNMLTNNIALYFVFRNWLFFLWIPCRTRDHREPLLGRGDTRNTGLDDLASVSHCSSRGALISGVQSIKNSNIAISVAS